MIKQPEILGTPGTPEVPEPSGRPQIPAILDFLNDKVILDANVFINYAKTPHEILNKVGGRPIHHSEDIFWELSGNSRDPLSPLDDSEEETNSKLDRFGSTLLPDTAEMKKVAAVISYFLPLAGIQSDQMDDAENDIRIMACGIVHKADIVTSDRLFYVMGKIFKTDIRIIFLGNPPEDWVTTASNTLKNQGFSTPIDLLELALNQDFTQSVLGLQL